MREQQMKTGNRLFGFRCATCLHVWMSENVEELSCPKCSSTMLTPVQSTNSGDQLKSLFILTIAALWGKALPIGIERLTKFDDKICERINKNRGKSVDKSIVDKFLDGYGSEDPKQK